MKRILSVILSALILCSVSACSSGSDSSAGEVDPGGNTSSFDNSSDSGSNDTETASDNDTESLPAKVDLRNYNGKNYVTPVKRQAFGDCWSFGIAAAAESSYLYANDLGTPASETDDEGLYKDNDTVNFSEKYLSWYVYHRITQEDVTPGKIRAQQVGEGYDTTAAISLAPPQRIAMEIISSAKTVFAQ